jgi:tripartite-type tricarboxylate transporter receptor subunit TctC
LLPEVPTLAELGLNGFEALPYYGIFAPTGTPPDVIKRYSTAIEKVLHQPQVLARLKGLGLTVDFMPPASLSERERDYSQSWARLIQDSGFVPK